MMMNPMTQREYAHYLWELGKVIAPKGDDEFVEKADELAFSRSLPDGLAAILVGLTGKISEQQGGQDNVMRICEDALKALNNGQTDQAAKILSKVLGKSETVSSPQPRMPKLVIASEQKDLMPK
jgi:hypothetical protein